MTMLSLELGEPEEEKKGLFVKVQRRKQQHSLRSHAEDVPILASKGGLTGNLY